MKKCYRIVVKSFLILNLILLILNHVNSDYIAQDDPDCEDDCATKTGDKQEECFNKLIDYHSYKLVKSVFNFGKASIYNGLWRLRYEHSDKNLFETLFNETLDKYNDTLVLGALSFDQLSQLARYTFDEFRPYMEAKEIEFDYGAIPSLKCPVTCTYEIITWQSLFYTALAIFLLALVAISLYSIFLHKQYKSMRKRLKLIRNSKSSNLKLTELN